MKYGKSAKILQEAVCYLAHKLIFLLNVLKAIAKMKTEFKAEKERKTEGIISDDDIDVQFMQLNLCSLNSTKCFVDDFIKSGKKLHVLICNAGIAMHKQGNTPICLNHLRYTCKK